MISVSYRLSSSSGGRGGFTLLELLLAVTMYGVMIGTLVSTVYTALRLRERTRERVEQSFVAEVAFQTLREDLRAMAPPKEPLQRQVYGVSLDNSFGRSDELEFGCYSGRVHPESVWGDLQLVRYKLIEPSELGLGSSRTSVRTAGSDGMSGEGLILARYVMRNLLSPLDLEEDPQVLLRNVLTLEFSYYSEEEWLDSWDSENMENAIPEAVEVRITYEIPDERASRQQGDRSYQGDLNRQETQVLCVPITVKPIAEPAETDEESDVEAGEGV